MNTTQNLGLGKPLVSEKYDITVFNQNADKIDTAVKDLQNKTRSASTGNVGITKLTDSITSTDTSSAATPNSVKQVNDKTIVLNNSKVDKVAGKSLTTNDLTNDLKANYDSAFSHSVSNHARVDATLTQKSATNGNVLINGTETNVYTHPATHAATMITQDSNHRFVTDKEKGVYTDKYTKTEIDKKTTTLTNSISSEASRAKAAEQAINDKITNIDNTADTDKPVSTAQQTAIDEAYANSNAYTDQKIADLIGGASSTMDTLKEVEDAMKSSSNVVEALEKAIGNKADQAELNGHLNNVDIHVTTDDKAAWNDSNSKKHSHSNKSVLDGITSALITAWNNAVEHINDTVKHITNDERILWNTVSNKVDKIKGKDLSSNDFTNTLKTKLDNIEDGANKYIHPTYTEKESGMYKIAVDSTGHINEATAVTKEDIEALGISGNGDIPVASYTTPGIVQIDYSPSNEDNGHVPSSYGTWKELDGKAPKEHTHTVVNGHTVESDVPENAKFTDTVYSHPNTSGNKHIPSGGKAGQILRWGADGTAVWGADNNTTYDVVSNTSNGLAPKLSGNTNTFLRGDGTYAVPPTTSVAKADNSTAGIMKLYDSLGSATDGSVTQAVVNTLAKKFDYTGKESIRYQDPADADNELIVNYQGIQMNGRYSNTTLDKTGMTTDGSIVAKTSITIGDSKATSIDNIFSSTSENPIQNKIISSFLYGDIVTTNTNWDNITDGYHMVQGSSDGWLSDNNAPIRAYILGYIYSWHKESSQMQVYFTTTNELWFRSNYDGTAWSDWTEFGQYTSFGNPTALVNYTESNPYTVPCDGYINIGLSVHAGQYIRLIIRDSKMSATKMYVTCMTPTNASLPITQAQTYFVKKGMKIYVEIKNIATEGVLTCSFIPLKN